MARRYKFRGKGKALGAEIVVIANNALQAKELARKQVEPDLDWSTFQCVESESFNVPSVVHFWDGDY